MARTRRIARITAKISLWLLPAIILPLALLSCSGKKANANQVTIRGKTWNVELATNEATWSRGLGGRERLADDQGMLFIFPNAAQREFWMKDCLISLDIVFIGPDRKVLNVWTMYAEPEETRSNPQKLYPSSGPAQFALEVPAGVMIHAGIEKGDVVTFSPAVEEAIKAVAKSGR